jgi:hypothetical protein
MVAEIKGIEHRKMITNLGKPRVGIKPVGMPLDPTQHGMLEDLNTTSAMRGLRLTA